MKAATALAGLIAFFSLTGQAPAPPAGPPLTINSCAFNTWTFLPVGAGGQLLVRFTPSTALKNVRFRMLWGDGTFTLVNDAGTFSSGAEIRHTLDFQHYGEITGETIRELALAADSVQQADGTTWEAPLRGTPSTRCVIYFGMHP
jgi:hypothetical protein